MKEQRWKGDYQTKDEEFRSARIEEQKGLDDVNRSFSNDYMASVSPVPLDAYQRGELDPSWSTQLDTTGMQPHAREYLERDMTGFRSGRKYTIMSGQVIDYSEGIQFSGTP